MIHLVLQVVLAVLVVVLVVLVVVVLLELDHRHPLHHQREMALRMSCSLHSLPAALAAELPQWAAAAPLWPLICSREKARSWALLLRLHQLDSQLPVTVNLLLVELPPPPS